MLNRIQELLSKDVSFSIETTLATRSFYKLVNQARKQGYKITLLYFWLSSPKLAEQRVAERVSKGGHNIPLDVIHTRYYRGIYNLFNIYMPIVDSWIIADNSQLPREIIAEGGIGKDTKIYNLIKFKTIESCQIKNIEN